MSAEATISVTERPTAQRAKGRLRVGFVAHPFCGSPYSGSTHIWVHEVARRLAAESCSPTVYTGGGSLRHWGRTDHLEGVEYRRLLIPSDNHWVKRIFDLPGLRGLKSSLSFQSKWYYRDHALQIARDVKARGYDVVHILNLSQFAPIIRAYNPKVKIVLHMHAEWLTRLDHSSVSDWLESVDKILSCSDFVTDQIRQAFPQCAHRCATIYNGVDVNAFHPSDGSTLKDAQRLLFVGVVGPHKGLHVLLEAMPAVLRRFPQARLDIVGASGMLPRDWLPTLGDPEEMARQVRFYDGRGYPAHLEEQIANLKLNGSVVLSGLLPRDELTRRYRESDVFVFPSLWNELFGIPTAEAMASGVPVVASRIAGLPEVVEDGKTGLLVQPGNPSALAKAIIQLLEDENLRRAMGRAGRQRVLEHFTWEKIAQDLSRHYSEVTATA